MSGLDRTQAEHLSGVGSREAIEFHVEVIVKLPRGWSAERRDETLRAELMRARELIDAGIIQRIWRVPGALHNVGIWRAGSAAELHAAIASLPCFPWLDVRVTAIAPHPAEIESRVT